MSAIFESYERQYCELSANLTAKCPATAILSGEQKKQNLAELKTGLDEAESLIRRMDLEARSLQPTQKAILLAKLREYKSDLNSLRRELKKLSSDTQVARDELLEAGLLDPLKASAGQRDRLVLSTERLNQSGERIKESKRNLLETEELGVSILQDLYQQRQTLLHAQDTKGGWSIGRLSSSSTKDKLGPAVCNEDDQSQKASSETPGIVAAFTMHRIWRVETKSGELRLRAQACFARPCNKTKTQTKTHNPDRVQ